MADRIYDANPAFVAPSFTRKADDDTIGFGKLLRKGTAAGTVRLADAAGTAATIAVVGYALPNEVTYEKSGNAVYVDEDVVTVMALMPGKIVYLYVDDSGDVAEGVYVEAATSGDIKTMIGHIHVENDSGGPTDATLGPKVIGVSLEAAVDNTWCKVLLV
jgi:hypothetical protein